jgi:hypothetical protein
MSIVGTRGGNLFLRGVACAPLYSVKRENQPPSAVPICSPPTGATPLPDALCPLSHYRPPPDSRAGVLFLGGYACASPASVTAMKTAAFHSLVSPPSTSTHRMPDALGPSSHHPPPPDSLAWPKCYFHSYSLVRPPPDSLAWPWCYFHSYSPVPPRPSLTSPSAVGLPPNYVFALPPSEVASTGTPLRQPDANLNPHTRTCSVSGCQSSKFTAHAPSCNLPPSPPSHLHPRRSPVCLCLGSVRRGLGLDTMCTARVYCWSPSY